MCQSNGLMRQWWLLMSAATHTFCLFIFLFTLRNDGLLKKCMGSMLSYNFIIMVFSFIWTEINKERKINALTETQLSSKKQLLVCAIYALADMLPMKQGSCCRKSEWPLGIDFELLSDARIKWEINYCFWCSWTIIGRKIGDLFYCCTTFSMISTNFSPQILDARKENNFKYSKRSWKNSSHSMTTDLYNEMFECSQMELFEITRHTVIITSHHRSQSLQIRAPSVNTIINKVLYSTSCFVIFLFTSFFFLSYN